MRAVAAVLVLCAASAAEEPFHEQVSKAIDSGVAWLKKRQKKDGSWDVVTWHTTYEGDQKVYPYPAGPTSLALMTLLKSGVAASMPQMASVRTTSN